MNPLPMFHSFGLTAGTLMPLLNGMRSVLYPGSLHYKQTGVIVPPAGGWHDTGDIVTIENGFIFIRGRAKRFAKIGGEMVSLAAVEAMASCFWPDNTHVCVALPDPRRGESLVLVTDRADADKTALAAHAQQQGTPELWVPKAILVTQQIPILGSGKVDFAATLENGPRSQAAPLG